MRAETIASRLFDQARTRPSAVAYGHKERGAWQTVTWQQYADQVKRAGRALMGAGVELGKSVCILGFNRPEWAIMDLAALCVGGSPAGIYTTSSPSEVAYIVHHADAPVVLVESREQWAKIEEKLGQLPGLKRVVLMQGAEAVVHPLVQTWEQFLATADGTSDEAFFERVDSLQPNALATLIYTSGTTGPPKGVMLSHSNLAWTSKEAVALIAAGPSDRALSYLPLSHIAEQMFTLHAAITAGYAVYFAESIEKLKENLTEVRPTVFFGVPRIWEKLYSAVRDKMANAPAARQKLAGWAMDVGRQTWSARFEGRNPSIAVAAQYAVANRLVHRKVKTALGLDQSRILVSGAAPIAKEVLAFFTGLDLPIYEVYGQSEDTGPTSFNRPGRTRLGTVGPAFPGVDINIAADGEILVRGPNVFLGYYKEPAATAETLENGWLHSGDLGAIDEQGFLSITGRKKDIIITAGGKNIAPKNIEAAIKELPLVGEAVVVGDRRKFLTALISLDDEARAAEAKTLGIDPADLPEHPSVRARLQAGLDRVNAELARVEQVKRFHVLSRAFSIATGELTPTLKVKRNVVYAMYTDEIEQMYAGEE